MKAIEFEANVEQDGTILIPEPHRRRLMADHKVRVVLLWPEQSEGDLWEREGARAFLEGDGPSDQLYDRI